MAGGDLQQRVSEQTVTVERQERELAELKHKMELLVKKAKEQSKSDILQYTYSKWFVTKNSNKTTTISAALVSHYNS